MFLLYRETDFAKQATEAFKSLEKKHPKRIGRVTAANSRLIEEGLLPMLVVQDRQSGEIVAQILNFSEYFPGKQSVTSESKCDSLIIDLYNTLISIDAEKLLRVKGVLEPVTIAPGKHFESKKDELEFELAVGSSYL